MRTSVLIALILPLAACSTTPTGTTYPYAEANSLMRREIQTRIAAFPFQHGAELLNNMLWLQTKAGETAVVDLLEALQHENPKVRSSATWVLGRIRDRRTIAKLRPLAADEHEAVRLEAARSLIVMGDLKYCTILIEGLDSDKTPVRYHCHMALKDATRKDFQYDHLEDDLTIRRTATLRWREWWVTQSSDPWFAASYARQHGLSSSIVEENAKPMGETGSDHDSGPGKNTNPGTKTKAGTGANDPKGEDTFKPLPMKSKLVPSKPDTTRPSPAEPKTTTPETTPKTTPSTTKTPAKTWSPIFKLLDLDDDSKTSTPKTSTPKTSTPKTKSPSQKVPTPWLETPTTTTRDTGSKTGQPPVTGAGKQAEGEKSSTTPKATKK